MLKSQGPGMSGHSAILGIWAGTGQAGQDKTASKRTKNRTNRRVFSFFRAHQLRLA